MEDLSSVPLSFAMQHQGKNGDEIEQLWAAQNQSNESNASTETQTASTTEAQTGVEKGGQASTQGQGTAETAAETTTEVVQQVAGVINYSEFGVNSADELKAKLARIQELEPIATKYGEVEKQLSYIEQVKNPFANDTIAQLNNFVAKTGISNLGIASEVIGSTSESLNADPLKAIAINELLSNPALSSLSIDQLRQYVADKNGVDMNEYGTEGYQMPITLKVDSAKAIQQIEEKRKEFANINNLFVDLQKNTEEQERLAAERTVKWNSAMPSIYSSVKEIEKTVSTGIDGVGEISVKLGVSQQEVQELARQMSGYFLGNEPTTEVLGQFQQSIINALRLAKQDEMMVEYGKALEGKLNEKLVREKHNLAPITEASANSKPKEEFFNPAKYAAAEMLKGNLNPNI
jgi:hypothetical protein